MMPVCLFWGDSRCPRPWRLGEPYTGPTRGGPGQSYAASRAEMCCQAAPQLLRHRSSPGVWHDEDPNSLTTMRHRWCCQIQLGPTSHEHA